MLNTQNMNHHRSLSSYTFISLYFYDRKLSKLQVYCQNRENKDCVKNGKKKKQNLDILARRYKVKPFTIGSNE